MRKSPYRLVPSDEVHHVTDPFPVGQYDGRLSVTDEGVETVTALAQCASRRILSSASRASCCAWKRLFMSTSAFVPWTSSTMRALMTVPKMTSTVSISMSV